MTLEPASARARSGRLPASRPSDPSLRSRRQCVSLAASALDVAHGVQYGEVPPSSLGRPHFQGLLRQIHRAFAVAAVTLGGLFAATPSPSVDRCWQVARSRPSAWTPSVVMSARCRSISLGIYSVTAWNVYALGIWPGLLQRRVDPAAWIKSTTIREFASVLEQAERSERAPAPPSSANVIHNKTNYCAWSNQSRQETSKVRRRKCWNAWWFPPKRGSISQTTQAVPVVI